MRTSSFVEVLNRQADAHGGERAFTFLGDGEHEEGSVSFAELDRQARAIAVLLRSIAQPGDRVVLLYPSGLEYIAAFFGCLYAGVVAVPAYPPDPSRLKRTLPRLQSIVEDARATAALTTAAILSMAEFVFAEAPELRQLTWRATDAGLDGLEADWRPPTLDGASLAFLQYTSGSTGSPKGVMVTHGNLLHNVQITREAMDQSAQTTVVGWLPLYHDMGLIGNILQPVYNASPCVLLSPIAFLQKPLRWLKAISNYRGTTSGGPNFAYDLCVRKVTEEDKRTLDLGSWTVAFNGAEPVRAETLERFSQAFASCGFQRPAFFPCYGLAEATLLVSGGPTQSKLTTCRLSTRDLRDNRVRAVAGETEETQLLVGSGIPRASQRLLIVNPEEKRRCADDEIGEVWVSGPSVAAGYWNKPEQTEQDFHARLPGDEDVFLRTGDLGFVRDGVVFITGRRKDLIIIRGANHYPQDIERTVERIHPALRPGGGAAFSVELQGDERLVVVHELDPRPLSAGTATADEAAARVTQLIEKIREEVANEHGLQVHAVQLLKVGSIPKTTSGKIRRGACRADFLAERLETIAAWQKGSVEEDAQALELGDSGAPPALNQAELEEWLRRRVAARLGVSIDAVDVGKPVDGLGLDSLAAVELQSDVESLGLNLSMVSFLQGRSITELVAEALRTPGAAAEVASASGSDGDAPLSLNQEQFWLLHQMAPESAAYNNAFLVRLPSKIDAARLRQAIEAVVDRHAVLRSTYHLGAQGNPVQRAHAQLSAPFARVDATSWTEEQLARHQLSEGRRPFALETGSSIRFSLYARAESQQLLIVAHHIAMDRWSVEILLRDMAALYAGKRLEPLALQVADLARRERAQLASGAFTAQIDYWRKQLAGSPELLSLPTDRPRPAAQSYRGAQRPVRFSNALLERLKRLGRDEGATLYMVLLAGFQALLGRYSRETDVLVGTPMTRRSHRETEGMIGSQINTLVMRTDLGGQPSVRELLRRVKDVAIGAYANQAAPFQRVVQEVAPAKRSTSHAPLFQVMLALQSRTQDKPLLLDGERLDPTEVDLETAKFDLYLELEEREAELVGVVEHNPDLFDGETVDRMVGHLEQLLEGMASQPSEPVDAVPLLSEGERDKIVGAWNDTARDHRRDLCVHELFAEQVAKTPTATALSFLGQRLTYRELDERAEHLAAQLRARGVGPEVRVGVCLERSLEMGVALLGVLKAGGAYVPLDPEYPRERLAFMAQDSRSALVLTTTRLRARIEGAESLCLDEELGPQPTSAPYAAVRPDNLAYVIYTSGSTGGPKGVAVAHRSVTSFLQFMKEALPLDGTDKVLQAAPFSFDVSVREILWPLLSGAEVILVPPGEHRDVDALVRIIEAEGATQARFVPLLLQSFVERSDLHRCRTLRRVFTGGEAIGRELVQRYRAAFPASLINTYGPTETTVNASYHRCVDDDPRRAVPIGRPVANAKLWILDERMALVPPGAVGELYIGGAPVVRGYVERPALTAAAFVPDPFATEPGARLYRTGDLAKWRADGTVEFVGRSDHQVKVRGFRIELGEIEAALARQPGVRDVVVVARTDEGTPPRLVAYLTGHGALDVDGLRDDLQRTLPEYMVPAAFMVLDALPLSPNGKVDRKALPQPVWQSDEAQYVAPTSLAEHKLAAIWAEVLRVPRVGVKDNFFALGGDSILSIQIASRARRDGLTLTPKQLFEHQTVEALAKAAGSATEVEAEQGLVAGSAPLSPIEAWFLEKRLPGLDHFNQSVLLRAKGRLRREVLEEALFALLRQHDGLRVRYRQKGGRWEKAWDGAVTPVALEHEDLSTLSGAVQAAALKESAARVQGGLDLDHGPLMRARLYELGYGEQRLLIAIHLMVVDGVSWRVLLEDLERAYGSIERGEPIELGKKTTSAKAWSEKLSRHAQSEAAERETAYWLSLPQDAAALPREGQGDNLGADVEEVCVVLDSDETQALLKEVPAAYRSQVNDALLTALTLAFGAWTGSSALRLDLEGHGREELFADADLTRTVGWFASLFPVVLDPGTAKSPGEALLRIKEQLRAVPQKGVGYGLLKYLGHAEVRAQLAAQPIPEVTFNYLGQLDQALSVAGLFQAASEPIGDEHSWKRVRAHLIDVNAMVVQGRLRVMFWYSHRLHHKATIEALAARFTSSLRELIAQSRTAEGVAYTPSDFPLASLSREELARLVPGGERVEDIYPLSPLQEGLLFHSLEGEAYVVQLGCLLRGPLDVDRFAAAWQRVVARHAILRTSFHWMGLKRPLQVVHEIVELPLHREDWRGLSADEQAERLSALWRDERRRGFRLEEAPLMRLSIVRVGDEAHRLLWMRHHLLFDGWSMPVVLREVFAEYEGLGAGSTPDVGYRRYIDWLGRQDLAKAEAHFRKALKNFSAPTALGVDRSLGEVGHAELGRELSEAATTSLSAMARAHQLTLNTVLQGAWGLLLSRYSGEADVVFGSTVSGRPADLAGVETMVGLFINALPVRVQVNGDEELGAWLSALQSQQVEARQYEHSPLPAVQGWSEVPRGRPLFESLVVYENYPLDEALRQRAGGLQVEEVRSVEETNYPLTVVGIPGKTLMLRIAYDRSRFDAQTVERMLAHLERLLAAMAARPRTRLGELSMLAEAERRQIVVEWNDTARELPTSCVHELFEAQAARTPDALALAFQGQRLSYRQLNDRANRLAARLSVGPEGAVGVLLPPGIDQAVALLAVLKAGGVYVPLDPALPIDRRDFMLADSGVRVLVTDGELAAKGLTVVRVDLDEEPARSSQPVVSPAGAAYVIYTSGSTGRPKGVVVSHQALGNHALSIARRYELAPSDRVLRFAAVGFDVALEEVLPTWISGGAVVYPEERGLSPRDLLGLCAVEGLTVLNLPAAYWHQLTDELGENRLPASIRLLITGSDRVSVAQHARFAAKADGCRFLSAYGPTEATITSLLFAPAMDAPSGADMPIGRPIDNVRAYLLDGNLAPVPVGVVGELALGGAGLARGYLNQAAATAERFIPDPFGPAGGRLYRTGDLGRYRPDGNIEFLGRIDHQVKIRGFRIELGEVESALAGHPDVREAVVLAREGAPGRKQLVAYVVARGGAAPTVEALRRHLESQLPEYMVPAAFVVLSALPLTASGKIDRKGLPAPEGADLGSTREYVAPRTERERKLARIWAELLRVEAVGIHDNFFELGGDSILSIQVVSRAREAGLGLTPKQLFEHPTVAELATVAGTAGAVDAEQAAVTGEVELTPIAKWFFEQELVDAQHFNQAVLLEARRPLEAQTLERSIAALIGHHDALRLRFARVDGRWSASSAGEVATADWFESIDLSALPADAQRAAIEAEGARLQAGLDLAGGCLLRAALFELGARGQRVLLVIHHLVVDGVSWRVLLADLERAYAQRGETIALSPKTTSLKAWSRRLSDYARTEEAEQELPYWLGHSRSAKLPVDHAGGANLEAHAQTVTVELTPQETEALLRAVPAAYRTTINDALLLAVGRAFSAWTGEPTLRLDLEGHGREALTDGVDVSRTVGWFTSLYPVELEVGRGGVGQALKAVKEQLRQIPKNGVGYGILKYLGRDEVKAQLAAQTPAEVCFNYLGQLDQALAADSLFGAANEGAGPAHAKGQQRPYLVELNGMVQGGVLRMAFAYSDKVHRRATIEALGASFVASLRELIAHCQSPEAGGYTPSDFPLAKLEQAKLDELLGREPKVEEVYPLSPTQAGMFFHSLYEPHSGVYCEELGCLIRGELEVEAFERAWQAVVDRHEVLRAAFYWEGLERPLQVVRSDVRVPFRYEDWRSLEPAEQTRRYEAHRDEERRQGFELGRAPLMRLWLARTGEAEHRFVWSHHHLLMDGWCLPVVFKDVLAFYDAYARGEQKMLGPSRPYRDYIAWLERQDLARAETHFREALRGFVAPTPFGVDRRNGEGGYAEIGRELTARATTALAAMSRANQVTLSTVVQGAWALLLSRYSRETDVVFGTTVSGRPAELAGVETMVGLFINTLPVRVQVNGEEPVATWLERLQAQQVAAREYEYSPLVAVQGWSEVPRSQPLFESLVVYENYPVDESLREQSGGLAFAEVRSVEQTNYPLTLLGVPGKTLTLRISYDRSRFDGSTIERMAGHLERLLEAMAENPKARLEELAMLSAGERQQVLVEWNDTQKRYPEAQSIHELFEEQACRTPEAIAVVCEGEQLTYRELDERTNQLGHYLRACGVGPDVLVGLCVARSLDMVVGLLGILKAGGAYVPLDPAYPEERIAYTLADAGVKVLLTQARLRQALPQHAADEVLLDEDWAAISAWSKEPLPNRTQAENLAYVIYTSGSTGRPKGVAIAHRSAVAFLHWASDVWADDESRVTLGATSICFDLSVYEIFGTLSRGAKLLLAQNALGLATLPAKDEVTLVNTVPSAAAELLRTGAIPVSVKTINLAGEPLSDALVQGLYAHGVERVLDLYGPSEDTTYSTFAQRAKGPGSVTTIGRPITNTQVYLLDAAQAPVPVGVAGELYLGGQGLARGYLNRPELTAEKFVPNPFDVAGSRLYRTGDLARYLTDGNLEYLGRIDHQVKIRGFRIELGEVESALRAHPEVREVLVMAREDGEGPRRLVAYLTAHGAAPTVDALRSHLKQQLPEYMVPSAFVVLEALPLTPNGKVDRKALPVPEGAQLGAASEYVAPRTDGERKLAEIWAELLRVPRVGIRDNFFELGGDSILSIQVVSRARAAGLGLSPKQLFEQQTIEDLARVAGHATLVDAEQGLVGGTAPLTPIEGWFFEEENGADHFNQALLLRLNRPVQTEVLEDAFVALLRQHDALRLRYRRVDRRWHKAISAELESVAIEREDLSALSGEAQTAQLEASATALQGSLCLATGPLVRARLYELGAGETRLLIVIHHLAVDGVSWRVLLEDLERAYEQLDRGEPVELGRKTTSTKAWADKLARYAHTVEAEAELAHWLRDAETSPLPREGSGANLADEGREITVALDESETESLLKEVPAIYRTQMNDALLTALGEAFRGWTGQGRLRVHLEGHGREDLFVDVDLTRTVGWFTSLFPVVLDLGSAQGADALKAVKEQLRAIPRRGVGYGILKYLGRDEVRAQLAAQPSAEVSFNYLGQLDQALREEGLFARATETSGAAHGRTRRRAHVLDVNASVMGGRLEIAFGYSERLHRRQTIEALGARFVASLRQLIAHCRSPEAGGYTPSDFPLAKLEQAALDRLLGRERQVEEVYPLSPMQAGMFFHSLYEAERGVYFEQFGCTIRGELKLEAFERAWQSVVERHEVLRTAFYWQGLERPLQVVRRELRLPFAQEDWRAVAPAEQAQRYEAHLSEERRRGFELGQAPLMRLWLARTGEAEHRLVWSYHHLLMDGWCLPIVFKDVLTAYEAYARGEQVELAKSRSYRDYIAWLEQQDLGRAEAYFKKALAGFAAPTPLGVDRLGGTGASGHAEIGRELSPGATTVLAAMARAHQLTLNTLVQGAWALLLSRYSREADVVFGATVSGRPAELTGVESMVGLFINTLPVRVQVSETEPVAAWLKALQAQQVEVRQFEYSPLVAVQGWSEVPRGLFDSVVVFENYPIDESLREQPGSLAFSDIRTVEQTNYPLTIVGVPGKSLSLRISYDRARFDRDTVERMALHLERLLAAMAARPEARLGELSLLDEAERRQILVDWNDTAHGYTKDRCIHELFEAQAQRTPQAIAIVHEGEQLSYRALSERANQLAHALKRRGVGPDVLVGLCVERSLDMVVGLLGILKAGGAYVPLDPAYPQDRLAFMLGDAGVKLLVTQAHLRQALPPHDAEVLALDDGTLGAEPTTAPQSQTRPEHLAYVIYTSGSTGRPKGALLEHRGLVNLVLAYIDRFALTPQSRVLQFFSFGFDASVEEIWKALLAGAQLHIVDPKDLGRQSLADRLRADRITVATLPPSVLASSGEGALSELKTIVSAGEACSAEIVGRWAPGRQFINGYGPTEATICATWAECSADEKPGIGRPLPNKQVYVLDRSLQPVPVYVAGELCIAGEGLARGYLKRPDLSAEKFVPNPFSPEPGARMYRSGDLGRYLPDGSIEYLGRIDHQVKIRGFRIELGEVESALGAHPALREAVVLAREDVPGQKRLCAYVTVRGSEAPPAEALRHHLEQRLPEYMVPSVFVVLESLPLTTNGKVDRKALPAPDGGLPQAYVGPKTPTEEVVAGLFEHVLRVGRVGAADDFFVLGGHSLLATQVVSRIRDTFGVELPLRQLFEVSTVAELARFIDEARRDTPSAPMERVGREAPLPLSFAQERLWFIDQLEPDSAAYNIPVAVRLAGALDLAALEHSLGALILRHETLRTTFATERGQAVQVVAEVAKLAMRVVDARGAGDRAQAVEEAARSEAQRPFDLRKGPLIRAVVVAVATDQHVLLLTMHHIVSDGWSMGVLVRDLGALYRAFVRKEAPRLPALAIQYADFAAWQRRHLSDEVLAEQLDYWKTQLAGAPALLELPTDRPRPATQSHRGLRFPLRLDKALTERLKALSRAEGATLFMTLLSGFQTLLGRYSRQSDVLVGTPIANRTRRETEGLIGFFVNTLVMRTDLGGDPTVRQLLRRVRETALAAYAHQDLPFEKVVDSVSPERSLSHTPLFQVMLVLQNAPMEEAELPGLRLEPLAVESGVAKFDLTLELTESSQGLAGGLEYNTDLFDRPTIERMAGHLERLLETMVERPGARLSELAMLSSAERQQILVAWNDTQKRYPQARSIHELFEAQASRTPEAIAAVCGRAQLSYRELDERSSQLGHYLRARGVGPEVLVGLCVERSLEMVVGLLGILKAGGAYVPLDPAYPQERIAYTLADAGVKVLLTQARLRSDLPQHGADEVLLDEDWSAIAICSKAPLVNLTQAENLAYVIYTSGSTGRPKGVAIAHRSAVAFLCWAKDVWADEESRITLGATSICFDLSVYEIFGTLSRGASLVVAENALALPALDDEITLVNTVPSAAAELLRTGGIPASVKTVNLAGEALSDALVQGLYAHGVERVLDLYGPSEDTTYSTYTVRAKGPGSVTTIGRPISNTQVYLLDAAQGPVPVGVAGELYLGGQGLARGYLSRPELTAEKFVPNPFDDSGSRLYRTGDLARYLPDGNLEYLGRIDHQVKIRGFRIELGEVESALRAHPEVREVLVIAREDGEGTKRLVAYLTAHGAAPMVDALRAHLKQQLPEYMVPAAFVVLEALPLTPNGKVDRKALPAPEGAQLGSSKEHVAPRTDGERRLAEIWAELLRVPRVGIHDNFFELGGDSILSIQVVSRARAAGLSLTPKQLFEQQTIEELARVAGHATAVDAEQGLVGGTAPLTPIEGWFFAEESETHHFNQALLLRLNRPVATEVLEEAFAVLLRQHDALRLRYRRIDGVWHKTISAELEPIAIEREDLSALSGEAQTAALEASATALQGSLGLASGPLLRARVYELGAGESRLLIVIHHLAVDGVSWRVLLEDLERAYEQLERGEPVELGKKTTSTKAWAEKLVRHAQTDEAEAELAHWLRDVETSPLPREGEGANLTAEAREVSVALEESETQALLKEVPAVYRTQMNDALLSALAEAFRGWTGESRLRVHLEGHGREDLFDDVDLTRTVGWFTSLFPVVLDLGLAQGPGEALKAVKEQLRAVPRRGVGYGILRYLGRDEVKAQLAAQPSAEVSFNYLGQLDQALRAEGLFGGASESSGEPHGRARPRAHLIDVNASVMGGRLRVAFTYSDQLHRPETIEGLGARFIESLRQLIAHCQSPEAGGYTPSDFPELGFDQGQLEALLDKVAGAADES